MKITLLTVGKNADLQIDNLIARYTERLKHYTRYEARSIPDAKPGKGSGMEQQKKAEGIAIIKALKPSDYVILLDERGTEYTSRQFADMLGKQITNSSRDIVFIVGGPFGFSQEVYDRADKLISLSKMTLTHEMVRLFFVEQLYRAFTIIKGESYHHD